MRERVECARPRCVVLDTDMLLLNDIGIVWSRFAHFGPTTMIATSIVVDHTPTSIMAIKLADLERAGVGLSLQVCASLTSQHMRPRGGHHPMRDRIDTPCPRPYFCDPGPPGALRQHLARMRDAGRWDVLMHKGWREEAWMMRTVSEQVRVRSRASFSKQCSNY